MLFVCSTTFTAAVKVVMIESGKGTTVGKLNAGLTIFVVTCVVAVLFWSAARWLAVWFSPGVPPNGNANGSGNGAAPEAPKPEGGA
jgi:carbon starvation protein